MIDERSQRRAHRRLRLRALVQLLFSESEAGAEQHIRKLSGERLARLQELLNAQQQAFNQATLAEKRARDREFGRHVRSVMENKRREKG